jgi:hypothetical protein
LTDTRGKEAQIKGTNCAAEALGAIVAGVDERRLRQEGTAAVEKQINVVPAAVITVGRRRWSIEEMKKRSLGHSAKHAARKTKNVARLTKPERDQRGVVNG